MLIDQLKNYSRKEPTLHCRMFLPISDIIRIPFLTYKNITFWPYSLIINWNCALLYFIWFLSIQRADFINRSFVENIKWITLVLWKIYQWDTWHTVNVEREDKNSFKIGKCNHNLDKFTLNQGRKQLNRSRCLGGIFEILIGLNDAIAQLLLLSPQFEHHKHIQLLEMFYSVHSHCVKGIWNTSTRPQFHASWSKYSANT